MITRIMLNKITFCSVILLISLSFFASESLEAKTTSEFHPLSYDQIPNILIMISDKTQSNYDRIKTWQGEIDVIVDAIYEGTKAKRILENKRSCAEKNAEVVREHRRSKIEFVADCNENFFYAKKCRINPRKYIDVETGTILCIRSVPWYNISIGTPEYQIRCIPDGKRGDSITSRKAVKKATQESCASFGSDVFDPRSFLIPGWRFWETFPRVLQYIKEHGEFSVDGHPLKVEECIDGTITKYRVQLPGWVNTEQYLFITMIFSGEKGFNITSLETTRSDGKLFNKMTWDYDLIDGVYLPNKTTKQDFTGDNAKLTYDRTSFFKNSRINHTIPAEKFTYKNLSLENGDKFIDKTLGKEYTFQDGELIPANSGSSYMPKKTIWPIANLNGDCCVNLEDLLIMASHWLDS